MKIIYLHQYFTTPMMSGGTRSYEFAKSLAKSGHEVHVVSSWRDADSRPFSFKTIEDGIYVHWLSVPYSNKMGFYSRIVAFLKFAIFASIKAVKLRGDVVFATSTPLTIAIPGIIASKLNNIPMVFEVRDLWPEVPIALGAVSNKIIIAMCKWLEKFAYSNSKYIVALAPGMKESIQKTCPSSVVEVIPNGCDFHLFSKECKVARKKIDDTFRNKKIVLYAGTIGKVNNVEYLVEVAQFMLSLDGRIVFVVVGEGNMSDAVRQMAIDKGVLDRNFFMMGQLRKSDMAEWFCAATLVAVFYKAPLCATSNSVQNKFFDALSASKPVVFEHSGWSVDLLESEGGGLRIPANNPEYAAELIREKIFDADWIDSAGNKSLHLGKRLFDRQVLAKRFEKVLVNAVNFTKNR